MSVEHLIVRHYGDREITDKLRKLCESGEAFFSFGGYDAVRIEEGRIAGRDNWEAYQNHSGEGEDYDGYELLDGRTQMNRILELFKRHKDMAKEHKPMIIVTGGDLALSQRMANMIIRAIPSMRVYNNGYGAVIKGDGLLVFWGGPNERYIYDAGKESGEAGVKYYKREKKNAIVLDARTELDKILLRLTGKSDLTLDMLVDPKLIQFIRGTPGDELVAGFIRKDHDLVLPREVQEQGVDTILAWLQKELGAGALKVAEPAAPVSASSINRRFKIKIEATERGRQRFRNSVDITVEGEVPEEVMQRAISENSYEVVQGWLVDNWRELPEVDRETVETNNDDEDVEVTDYDDVSDDISVEQQFNRALGVTA